MGNRIAWPPICSIRQTNEPLEAYLSNKVFAGDNSTTIAPDQADVMALRPSWNVTKRDLLSKEPPWMR